MLPTRIAVALCASTFLIVGGISSVGMLSGGAEGAGIFVLVSVTLLCGLCGILATLPWRGREQARAAAAIASSLYFALCLIVLIVNFCMAVAGKNKGAGDANATSLGMLVMTAFLLTYVALLNRLRRLVPGNEQKRSRSSLIWYIATMVVFAGMGGVNGFFVLRENIRRSLIVNQQPTAPAPRPESVIQVPDFNYQVKSPGGKWRQAEKGAFHKDATLVLTNSPDDQYFIVIAEDIGDPPQFDLDTYIATVKTKVSAGMDLFEPGTLEPMDIAGASGMFMPAKARTKATDLQYYYWFAIHNRVAYQVVTAGSSSMAPAVEASARNLLSRFSFIDPNWSLEAARTSNVVKQVAPEYGLTFDLVGSGWYPQSSNGADNELSRFSVQRGTDFACEVTAVDLADETPTDEALAYAMLRFFRFEFPGEKIVQTSTTESDGIRTTTFSAEREVESVRYAYRFRMLCRGTIVCIAGAWQPASRTDRSELNKILDRVSLADPSPASHVPAAGRRIAYFWNGIGLYDFDQDKYAAAESSFRKACNANPKEPLYTQNVVHALQNQRKFVEAASFLKEHLGAAPGEAFLQLYADVLEQAEDINSAIDTYARMLEIPSARQKALAARNRLMVAARRFDEADADLEKYKSLGPNRSLHAKVLRARGQVDDAAAVLRAGLEADPIDTAAGEDLIDLSVDLDRFTDVIEASDRLSGAGYRTAYTLYHKGSAEFSLDRLPAARKSLEDAQKLAPADKSVKELLQRVQTRLGQGDPTLFKDPIDAVPMPAQALEGASPFETDAGVIYRHRVSCFKFVPGSDFRQTSYYKFTLKDRREIDDLSTFRFDFDPEFERLFVNKLEVRDPNGELVSTGDVATYFVSSDSQGGIASQSMTLHIPINALAPGRTVELAVTRRDLSNPKTLPFHRWFLVSHYALERGAVTIEAPEGEFAFHAENGARTVPFSGGVAFVFDHHAAWEIEPWGASINKFVPAVVFGDRRSDWATLGREYLAKISERLEITQSVRDLAASLAPKPGDLAATVRDIATYVQKEFGYRAIEFGPRAQIPTPASEIVANRFGDCKDHSLLFVQLLESLGIHAYLTLAATDFPVVDDIPSRLQFNHMIAYVPSLNLFIDLTDKYSDPLLQPPTALSGKQVLVLDPSGPALKPLGDYPRPAALVETQREIEAVDRDLSVRETITLSGVASSWLREIAQSQKNRLIEQFSPLYSPTGAQILEVTPVDPHDTSKPLVIHLRYTVPGALLDVGGHTSVTLPYVFDRRWYVLRRVDQRQTPMEVACTSTCRSITTLKFGPGAKLVRPDSPFWRRETPAASAERKASTRGDDIVIEASLTLNEGDYPATEYNPCAALTSEAVASFERDIVITRAPKPE